jgi:guanylate kinase
MLKKVKGTIIMKVLFLVDGAAGAGKSDLVSYIANTFKNTATKIDKFTTRKKRSTEEAKKSDLIFISEEEFKEKELNKKDILFTYTYGKSKYGFYKSKLDDAIEKYNCTFIIIRNQDLIEKICSIYKDRILVVPIYVYTDMGLIEARLREDGYDDDMIKFRVERSQAVFNEYLENDIYRNIVINRSNVRDLHRKIRLLMDKYAKIDEQEDKLYVSPLQYFRLFNLTYHKKRLQKQLSKYPYEKNVFLMMKFRKNNEPFYGFIKNELERCGYNCVRADAPEWNLTDNVYNPIAALYCCKYGIALFDEPEASANYNPNVAYELGIMHNQGKKCLILKHSLLKEVPFDLVKELYKPYTREIEFQTIFSEWLVSLNN